MSLASKNLSIKQRAHVNVEKEHLKKEKTPKINKNVTLKKII